MKKLCKYLHLLQFDIALGAVAISIWFAQLENIEYNLLISILLGISVWVIYTSDHLLDAYRYREQIKGGRYEYFHRNWKVLSVLCIVLAIPSMILAFTLSSEVWTVGLGLSGIVLLYLFLAHFARSKFFLLKELFVAIIYAGGVLTANIAMQGFWQISLLFFWLFAVVFCELLIYSKLELVEDAKMNMPSLTKQYGAKQICFIHDLLLGAAFISWLLLSYRYSFALLWILPSSIMLLMMLLFRNKGPLLYQKGTHRRYGELIFMIPWIAILINFMITTL